MPQTLCNPAISPQPLSPRKRPQPSGLEPVFPVIHTPYDYYERFS